MSDISTTSSAIIRRFWIADVIVLVIFLSTAVYGIYLFHQDLMQTIDSRGAPAVGIIVIKNNIVQRRYEDRAIWERLVVDSPVYSGDLVRAAELSDATIHIDEHQIVLNENSLIRIQHAAGEDWAFEVELQEGNVSVVSASGEKEGLQTGLMLNLMGRQVQLASGTMLSAEIGEDGLVVKVNEGTAVFVENGQEREIAEGEMIAKDKDGNDRPIPAAVVTSVMPNAHYLKTSSQPLNIDFYWTSINIENNETVRLEIASDKKFTKDFLAITGRNNHAAAAFNAGVWHWRLFLGEGSTLAGFVLSRGQITVAEGAGPELASPVDATVFRYFSALPKIRFQWAKKSGASNYIVEICRNKDFKESQIERQTASSSIIQDGLDDGIWYWRVLPIFPDIYQGNADYSTIGSFQIEKTDDPHAPAIEISETVLAVKTAISKANAAGAAAGRSAAENARAVGTAAGSVAADSARAVRTAVGSVADSARAVGTAAGRSAAENARAVGTAAGSVAADSARAVRTVADNTAAGLFGARQSNADSNTTGSPARSAGATSGTSVVIPGSFYTVISGDTLSRIAGRAYGDPYKWPRISDENKLPNPDLILVNQVLFIP